ncbi:M16 family metallopeptidase [Verrucomicrobiota bacterium]
MEVSVTRLDNGARVATSTLAHVESVSVGVWVGVGSRYESNRLAGMSHFIEHLLFKGTAKRTAKDISAAVEGCGGYLNAFTQEESTCYYARVPFDRAWRALDVLADMYFHPRLDPKDIDKEKGVVIEEIMMYRDQPHHVVQEMLASEMWRKHPVGRPVIGSPETLAAVSREDILGYKNRKYVPANTVFAFAGRIGHDACVRRVERLAADAPAGRLPSLQRVTGRVAQGSAVFQTKDIEQSHLALGVRLFGRNDTRRHALKILNVVLGENMSSRLFQIVREKHGLAYSVHSAVQLFDETGALVISAGLDRKSKVKALELIVRELVRLKSQPVGAAELKRAKDYVIGQIRLALESTSHRMTWVGDNILTYGRFVTPEETIGKIEAVSASDVQALAREVIRKRRTTLAVIAPDISREDKARMRTALNALSGSGVGPRNQVPPRPWTRIVPSKH